MACHVVWNFIAAAFLLCLISLQRVAGQNYSFATTKYGVVRGNYIYDGQEDSDGPDYFVYEQYSTVYLGIPYAKPPVGELRFKRPLPPDPWEDTLVTDTMPPACVQYSEYQFPWYDSEPGQSEDCLYLNVYAPYQRETDLKKRPVKLYIHGGGFTTGSNRMPYFDGFNDTLDTFNPTAEDAYDRETAVSSFYGFVDVVINYRLGALGFLTSGTEDAPGNVGLYDMVAAIQWVRDNIEAFGGDPDLITLYGQGAGAVAVSIFCVSPLTDGLFRRAVLMGGNFLGGGIDRDAFSDNLRLSDRLANAVGCDATSLETDPEATVECLRNVDATELAKTLSSFDPTSHYFFYPHYGQDDLLPSDPVALLSLGRINRLSGIYLGFAADEGSYLLTTLRPDVFGVFGENNVEIDESFAKTALVEFLDKNNYPQPEEIADQLLRDGDGDTRKRLYSAMGNENVVCPMVFFAGMMADLNQEVYIFEITAPQTYNPWAEWMGVAHNTAQLDFYRPYKYLHINGGSYFPNERELNSNSLSRMIQAQFLYSGSAGPAYEPFTSEDQHYYILDEDSQYAGRMDQKQYKCEIFREYHAIT